MCSPGEEGGAAISGPADGLPRTGELKPLAEDDAWRGRGVHILNGLSGREPFFTYLVFPSLKVIPVKLSDLIRYTNESYLR